MQKGKIFRIKEFVPALCPRLCYAHSPRNPGAETQRRNEEK